MTYLIGKKELEDKIKEVKNHTSYFHRIHKVSPTRFWINNPTRDEADLAIAAGAISCTCNPAYPMKMVQREPEEYAFKIVDEVIKDTDDDNKAVDLVMQKFTKSILDKFLTLYEQNPEKEGFVSIQGNPLFDDDSDHIIKEALEYRKLRKNIIAKIPATQAGIKAMETLIPKGIPIIATEIMGIPQTVSTCEMYKRVTQASGKTPPFYITHITGIFEEHIKNIATRDNLDISEDVLSQAGCIVARKQYQVFKERNYPGIMLGGGARGLHHFTEFVGSEMHITINWTGTADKLIEQNPIVLNRMNTPPFPEDAVNELLEKIPDFRKAYLEDELTIEEYKGYGPVVCFRESFVREWNNLLSIIRYRRSFNKPLKEY